MLRHTPFRSTLEDPHEVYPRDKGFFDEFDRRSRRTLFRLLAVVGLLILALVALGLD